MTVHKLSAGDRYSYPTNQAASADQRRNVGQRLNDHYQESRALEFTRPYQLTNSTCSPETSRF